MKPLGVLVALAAVGMVVSLARGGHELPVYPSYYPHEIVVESVSPERAAGLLLGNKIGAYLDGAPRFSDKLPPSIGAVESLGSFVTVRLNPASPSAKDEPAACAVIDAVVRGIADKSQSKSRFVFHPYPVTPFHGDYIYHVDLAEAAKARFLQTPAERSAPPIATLRVKTDGAVANLVRPEWKAAGSAWDAAIEEVDAADLVASSTTSINGWLGPPWVKAGWFHAERIMGDAIGDAETRRRADAAFERLRAGDYRDGAERANLQRELVTALTGNCRKLVVGYTVKRQYFNTDFTDGIENIGFDSIEGLNSPMFIRTVKLKDFPWNGWLALGIDSAPHAAWNPVAGFNDGFGRLLWSAVSDPALLYAPYDSGWMINRISDVQANSGR